jgi:hypothetical protein
VIDDVQNALPFIPNLPCLYDNVLLTCKQNWRFANFRNILNSARQRPHDAEINFVRETMMTPKVEHM